MKVLCVGFPSIDHIAQVMSVEHRAQTRTIAQIWPAPTPGGCPGNIAVGLARLGARSVVHFALGDDPDSQWYLEQLNRAGVDTQSVYCQANQKAAKTFIFTDPDGLSELFYYPGANQDLELEPDLEGIGLLVITVGPASFTQSSFARAAQAKVPVAWQMKQDPRGLPDTLLGEFLAQSQLLFANQAEATHLLKALNLNTYEDLLLHGPSLLVQTQGAQGSLVVSVEGRVEIPCVPARAIETTGAGDGYTAGFLYGWIAGFPPQVCGQLGAVVSSFVVEQWGCQAGLPDLKALRGRYEQHFGPWPEVGP